MSNVLDPTTPLLPIPPGKLGLPTHKDLPDKDEAMVQNYQEHPQSSLLTGCLTPRLQELRPDGRFSIGRDNGIYWAVTEPPLRGCKSPDFFVVLGVEPTLHGEIRRSYVLWQEQVFPTLLIEYVSGDGSEERDRTPETGKLWVYENRIRAPHYIIFDGWRRILEARRLVEGAYHSVEPNERGRFPVPELGVEFGLWDGVYERVQTVWVRPWSLATGEMLPSLEEAATQDRQRADAERQRADAERQRADAERQRGDLLAERLRALGIDPDAA